MELLPFQKQAITTLLNFFYFSKKETTLFYSPTGSGKTIMLVNLIDRIIETNPNPYDYVFVWLTPGNGELEEQSWEKANKFGKNFRSLDFEDALTEGFQANTSTFINWEKVKNKSSIALRNGEHKNLKDIIKSAHSDDLHFVVIIDEEHRDQTEKADGIIELFNADKIIRASATPKSKSELYDNVQVNDEDVISQGLIVRNVLLNHGGADGDIVDNMVQYFIDFADEKRREIKEEYRKLKIDLNPLVLVQFPDEKKSNRIERNQLINQVKDYLREIGQEDEQIATWLADEKVNINNIEQKNSRVNYLLMKQAISTGWDAPRAKILVKLRMNSDPNFTLQTVGRIRRMPEQKHYNNELLDNAFIYSNDQKYLTELLQRKEGAFISTFELKKEAPDFRISSIKPRSRTSITVREVVEGLRKQFKKDYGIVEQNGSKNKEKLESFGYRFGTILYQKLTISDKIERDILSGQFYSYEVNLPVSYKDNSLDLLNAEQMIQKYMYLDSTKEVNHVLLELFSNRSEEASKRFLSLKPSEYMAFVINNYKLIRDVAKRADANGLFNKQLSFEYELAHNKADLVELEIPLYERYLVSKKPNARVFEKNIYKGYSENNWVQTKKPEIAFEKWLESNDKVKWWYKSKNRGDQYFSVAYGQKKEGFFPDYLILGTDGITYVVETKGGNKENRDLYVDEKFKALREWSENPTTNPNRAKFAFVRPIKDVDGEVVGLVFNNTKWDEIITNSEHWKPISDFFGDDLL